jgi:hypothetical protein
MKKLVLLVCVLSFLSLGLFVGPSQALRISVEPSQTETFVNHQGWYNIQIYNDDPVSGEFVITVMGPHLEWLNLGGYFTKIAGYEKQDIGLFFYPKTEGTYDYQILVYSKDNPVIVDTKSVTLLVKPEKEFDVKEMTCSKTGSDVEVIMQVTSKSSRSVTIPVDITDAAGNVIKHADITQQVDGPMEIRQTITVPELLAGNYFVKVSMPQFGVKAESSFSVAALHRVVTKKETISTPLGQQVVITVTNEGNTPEDYVASDNVQANQYVGFVDAPASTYVEGNDVSYNWRVTGLAVGKSVSFVYGISRLPFLIGSFIMIFCVVALLGMGAVKVRTPNIKKRHVKKNKEHIIVLEIKGPLTSDLKSVVVKDRVSPLGKVMPEFGGPKPVVRESEYGTELIWNLGDMKPRSEIFLSYKIQPLVEAQLKMPRAYLSYRTGAAETEGKIKVFSREVILE